MFLTRENSELREQNEVSRLACPVAPWVAKFGRQCFAKSLSSCAQQTTQRPTQRAHTAQILRRVLSRETDSSVMELLEYLRSENQALKVAVYDTAQTLAMTTGALEKGMPHAATALAAAVAEEEAAGGAPAPSAVAAGLTFGRPAGSSSAANPAAGGTGPGH